jgi:hypothetical protein
MTTKLLATKKQWLSIGHMYSDWKIVGRQLTDLPEKGAKDPNTTNSLVLAKSRTKMFIAHKNSLHASRLQ